MSGSIPAFDRSRLLRVSRRSLIAGGLAAALVVVAPLVVWSHQSEDDPEVRVLRTRDRATALIADGDARVLVVNSPDREAARDAMGRASRPWEPLPQLLISFSDDDAAVGLLEALDRSRPTGVIVAGVPGADPIWARVQQLCRERAIPIEFVTTMVTTETARLRISVLGAEPDHATARAVIIQRGDSSVVIAFDEGHQPADGQVLIADSDGTGVTADMLVTVDDTPRRVVRDEVLVRSRDLVRIAISAIDVKITGGRYRGPHRP